MSSVSILGCGWLGFPLAKKLIEHGYKVKGSTTTASKLHNLKRSGIEAFQIQLPDNNIDPDFFNSDYLVINIPPKTSKNGLNYHKDSLKSITDLIPSGQKIIYVSATSVYPKVNEPIDEDHDLDLQSERALALIQAEELLQAKFSSDLAIIRFGGLLGYDRIPGKYFSGKKVEQHQQKVNYIHRDDAIGIIIAFLNQNQPSLILNGVAPKHPSKQEVFLKNAEDFQFEPPQFENEKQELTERIIISSRIELILEYSFTYPDPLHFFYTN